MCPRSSDPFYIVSYYIKWVTTTWTHSMLNMFTFDELSVSPLLSLQFLGVMSYHMHMENMQYAKFNKTFHIDL